MTETQTQPSVMSVALKYGLLTGLFYIFYSLFTYLTESFSSIFLGIGVTTLIAIVGIVLAMREYKLNNFGYMSYGQGLGLGILTLIIASILSGIFSYIYLEFIDPSIMSKMIDASMEQMAQFGVDEDMLETQREAAEADMTPFKQLTNSVIGGFFSGLILSLIISAFMKHNRPQFE